MEAINLNQIPTEYIMRTKGGKLWRCGKGYRKDWNKLIGKLVLLHNTPYTLINRIKEAGKWYLVFTDGTSNYTERQDKALHNKKLAKDTIIETATRVIAGLLPAPMDPLDYYVAQCINIKNNFNNSLLSNPNNYTRKNTLKRAVQRQIINYEAPCKDILGTTILGNLIYDEEMYYDDQVSFISNVCYAIHDMVLLRNIKQQLIRSYHEDTNKYFADAIKLDCVKRIYIDNEEDLVC